MENTTTRDKFVEERFRARLHHVLVHGPITDLSDDQWKIVDEYCHLRVLHGSTHIPVRNIQTYPVLGRSILLALFEACDEQVRFDFETHARAAQAHKVAVDEFRGVLSDYK